MKKLSSVILAISILALSISNLGVYLSFEINKDFIVNALCIEKEQKENNCQGSCHLAKKLRAQEKQNEHEGTELESKRVPLNWIGTRMTNHSLLLQITHLCQFQNQNLNLIPKLFSADIFHPPR